MLGLTKKGAWSRIGQLVECTSFYQRPFWTSQGHLQNGSWAPSRVYIRLGGPHLNHHCLPSTATFVKVAWGCWHYSIEQLLLSAEAPTLMRQMEEATAQWLPLVEEVAVMVWLDEKELVQPARRWHWQSAAAKQVTVNELRLLWPAVDRIGNSVTALKVCTCCWQHILSMSWQTMFNLTAV